jgi:hypothetical protein
MTERDVGDLELDEKQGPNNQTGGRGIGEEGRGGREEGGGDEKRKGRETRANFFFPGKTRALTSPKFSDFAPKETYSPSSWR